MENGETQSILPMGRPKKIDITKSIGNVHR